MGHCVSLLSHGAGENTVSGYCFVTSYFIAMYQVRRTSTSVYSRLDGDLSVYYTVSGYCSLRILRPLTQYLTCMMAALLSSWWSGKSPEGEKEGEESKADSWSTGIGSEKPHILNCVDIVFLFKLNSIYPIVSSHWSSGGGHVFCRV